MMSAMPPTQKEGAEWEACLGQRVCRPQMCPSGKIFTPGKNKAEIPPNINPLFCNTLLFFIFYSPTFYTFSDQTCMWRDKQARRWGNTFDLHKIYQFSSKTGVGVPNFEVDGTNAELGWTSRLYLDEEAIRAAKAVGNATDDMWRYASIDISVVSNYPKWFYFVISNCLPFKEIEKEELTTGTSSDSNYDVVGDQLACSLSGDTFCQGPLDNVWYVFFSLHSAHTNMYTIDVLTFFLSFVRYDVQFKNGESNVSYDESWMLDIRVTMVCIYGVLVIIVMSHVYR